MDAVADASVTAVVVDDTSGGRFAITQVARYHIESADPSEFPHHHGPLPKVLVQDGRVGGAGPLAVFAGDMVGVMVTFSSAAVNAAFSYTGT